MRFIKVEAFAIKRRHKRHLQRADDDVDDDVDDGDQRRPLPQGQTEAAAVVRQHGRGLHRRRHFRQLSTAPRLYLSKTICDGG